MRHATTLCSALFLMCLVPLALFGEEKKVATPAEEERIERLLQELRNTPDQRSKIRANIARESADNKERARILMEKCEALLKKEPTETDKNFLFHVATLVGERGDRVAHPSLTDVLLKTLETKSMQLRYATVRSLGMLWDRVGRGNDVPDKCKEVNTELVSLLTMDIQDVEIYAIGYALFAINDIPPLRRKNPLTNKVEDVDYSQVSPAELREYLEEWSRSDAASKLLLPLERRRPLSILDVLLKSTQEAQRQRARKVLENLRPLECVDKILSILPDAVASNKLEQRDDLAALLGAITDTPLSIRHVTNRREAEIELAKWYEKFQEYVSTKKEDRFRKYIATKFVEELTRTLNPVPVQIEKWRWIFLRNFDKPEEIPKDFPETLYKRLIETPLIRKGEIEACVREIETKRGGDKLVAIKKFQTQLLHNEDDKKLARLCLPRLVVVLKEEKTRRTIQELRDLLRDISDYPMMPIEDLDPVERQRVIDQWWEEVKKQVYDVWLSGIRIRGAEPFR